MELTEKQYRDLTDAVYGLLCERVWTNAASFSTELLVRIDITPAPEPSPAGMNLTEKQRVSLRAACVEITRKLSEEPCDGIEKWWCSGVFLAIKMEALILDRLSQSAPEPPAASDAELFPGEREALKRAADTLASQPPQTQAEQVAAVADALRDRGKAISDAKLAEAMLDADCEARGVTWRDLEGCPTGDYWIRGMTAALAVARKHIEREVYKRTAAPLDASISQLSGQLEAATKRADDLARDADVDKLVIKCCRLWAKEAEVQLEAALAEPNEGEIALFQQAYSVSSAITKWEARVEAVKAFLASRRAPQSPTPESAEGYLARVGYADSRVHSAGAIAKLMEDYAAQMIAEFKAQAPTSEERATLTKAKDAAK